MPKRAQERRIGEELVVAKSRPVSLMSRSLTAKQSPCWIRVNHTARRIADWVEIQKFGRDRNENSASSSQVWRRDDNPFPRTERSVREMNERSSTGKPGREVQNQLTEVTLDHDNVEICSNRFFEKVFSNIRQKVESPEDDQRVLDQKVNVLMW